ncbi:hypothetical protein V1511DRAFT_512399 [Dipodascopsis uninucleata]
MVSVSIPFWTKNTDVSRYNNNEHHEHGDFAEYTKYMNSAPRRRSSLRSRRSQNYHNSQCPDTVVDSSGKHTFFYSGFEAARSLISSKLHWFRDREKRSKNSIPASIAVSPGTSFLDSRTTKNRTTRSLSSQSLRSSFSESGCSTCSSVSKTSTRSRSSRASQRALIPHFHPNHHRHTQPGAPWLSKLPLSPIISRVLRYSHSCDCPSYSCPPAPPPSPTRDSCDTKEFDECDSSASQYRPGILANFNSCWGIDDCYSLWCDITRSRRRQQRHADEEKELQLLSTDNELTKCNSRRRSCSQSFSKYFSFISRPCSMEQNILSDTQSIETSEASSASNMIEASEQSEYADPWSLFLTPTEQELIDRENAQNPFYLSFTWLLNGISFTFNIDSSDRSNGPDVADNSTTELNTSQPASDESAPPSGTTLRRRSTTHSRTAAVEVMSPIAEEAVSDRLPASKKSCDLTDRSDVYYWDTTILDP